MAYSTSPEIRRSLLKRAQARYILTVLRQAEDVPNDHPFHIRESKKSVARMDVWMRSYARIHSWLINRGEHSLTHEAAKQTIMTMIERNELLQPMLKDW